VTKRQQITDLMSVVKKKKYLVRRKDLEKNSPYEINRAWWAFCHGNLPCLLRSLHNRNQRLASQVERRLKHQQYLTSKKLFVKESPAVAQSEPEQATLVESIIGIAYCSSCGAALRGAEADSHCYICDQWPR